MKIEEGTIKEVGYALDNKYESPLLRLVIKGEDGWYSSLDFTRDVHSKIFSLANDSSLILLLGLRVYMLSYPGEGLKKAPIAISDRSSGWIYKKEYDQNGNRLEEKE